MSNIDKQKLTHDLFAALAQLKDKEAFAVFFEDLCTYKEIEQMAQRVACAKLLLEGNTYLQIIAKTDISSATLSRVSRCLQHGSGGYREILPAILAKGEEQ